MSQTRKLPPLNAVRIFESAARNMSFTAAARELNITTAAVSHQMRHLEEFLGHSLFERSSRKIKLSPVGERMLPMLTEGFDRLADAFDEIDERKSASVVAVTTTRSFAERWLLPRLPKLRALYPATLINLDASDTIVDLSAREADVAIRYGRDNDEGLQSIKLFDDRYLPICHSSIWESSAAPKLTDLNPRPLLAYRYINHTLNPPDWGHWFERSGLDRSAFRVSWFNEEGLSIQAMEHGYGALLCSDALVQDDLLAGACRRIDGPSLEGMRYRVLIAPMGARKKGVQVFIDWLRQEVAEFTAARANLA
jgi:LysR family glycine cleavage system transcriptional activator